MDEKSLNFVNQLIEKTEQGKLSWSAGFEDGQFKTLLPGGKLAFVIQKKEGVLKFRMLDERQEVILRESLQGRYVPGAPGGTPGSPTFQTYDENGLLRFSYLGDRVDELFEAMKRLQELAQDQALQVDDKLAKAEKLLAAI